MYLSSIFSRIRSKLCLWIVLAVFLLRVRLTFIKYTDFQSTFYSNHLVVYEHEAIQTHQTHCVLIQHRDRRRCAVLKWLYYQYVGSIIWPMISDVSGLLKCVIWASGSLRKKKPEVQEVLDNNKKKNINANFNSFNKVREATEITFFFLNDLHMNYRHDVCKYNRVRKRYWIKCIKYL